MREEEREERERTFKYNSAVLKFDGSIIGGHVASDNELGGDPEGGTIEDEVAIN